VPNPRIYCNFITDDVDVDIAAALLAIHNTHTIPLQALSQEMEDKGPQKLTDQALQRNVGMPS